MSVHAELLSIWHLYQTLRHQHGQAIDPLGFGYSRTDTQPDQNSAVPDGVELHAFTGRTRKEATR